MRKIAVSFMALVVLAAGNICAVEAAFASAPGHHQMDEAQSNDLHAMGAAEHGHGKHQDKQSSHGCDSDGGKCLSLCCQDLAANLDSQKVLDLGSKGKIGRIDGALFVAAIENTSFISKGYQRRFDINPPGASPQFFFLLTLFTNAPPLV